MNNFIKIIAIALFCVLVVQSGYSQKTFPQDGVYDEREGLYALTNAKIYVAYNEFLNKATLLIRNGKVEQVGANLVIPKDAVVIDLNGKYIYPSFVDIYSNYGMPEPKAEGQSPKQQPQALSNKKGAYSWNEAMKTEFKAADAFAVNEKSAEELRGIGFGTVSTHRFDGISRGTSALVSLKIDKEHQVILQTQTAHHLAFNKGTSTQAYPNSLMGIIALLRQTYLDGQWYANEGNKVEQNLSLEAWNQVQLMPQIFETYDRLEALRALRIGTENRVNYIIKGVGDEYQRLDQLKATGAAFIVPLTFPDAYEVDDAFDALNVSIGDMKHWELAATNPGRLQLAGVPFCITSHGLKNKADFMKNLQKAIENGLAEEDALKALTITPATLIGAQNLVGSLNRGKVASFLVTSGKIFEKTTKIYQNWVQGKLYTLKDMDIPEIAGSYRLQCKEIGNYTVTTENGETSAKLDGDSTKIKINLSQNKNLINLSFNQTADRTLVRLSGIIEGAQWKGSGQVGDGKFVVWEATKLAIDTANAPKINKDSIKEKAPLGDVVYPFNAYGWKKVPEIGNYLLKNATVWTNEFDGILENTDVLIQNGKIVQIGKNLKIQGLITNIDATGKHVTAGIIDEHSHIAISRGVNEGTQSCTSEVRIGDVLNSEDVNIYRQLAGGVTSSHLLHGSANAIGGQTQLIKLRWGYKPEDLKYEGWDPFIKFALGENVKQSNWGEDYNVRYPQSRMGVEQVFEDHFTRAEEYKAAKIAKKNVRKDLELEALQEILDKKRFITCHSYQQAEITMLMRVAERHNFVVNTFTHILEGYKVADKMKLHGAGAAGFSDWWAYKYEVYEAIPYNGAILHEQGVVTAFNSDDAEMARRLNQEAGKACLYGKVSEEDAWKFVTLNPAKLLHIDNKVGSIKVGKDADVVLWSDNPLSIYAKAEMTFVDGIKFFDRKEDEAKQQEIRQERARLIQKMIDAKKGGAPVQTVKPKPKKLYHCDDNEDEAR
jgi:imidazolonepropionase-like amidohydrolase